MLHLFGIQMQGWEISGSHIPNFILNILILKTGKKFIVIVTSTFIRFTDVSNLFYLNLNYWFDFLENMLTFLLSHVTYWYLMQAWIQFWITDMITF